MATFHMEKEAWSHRLGWWFVNWTKLWKNVFVSCLGFSPSYVHILKVVIYDKNNITSSIFNFYCLEHKNCIRWYVWASIQLLVTTCQKKFRTPLWCQILLHLLLTFHYMISISSKTLPRMQQTLISQSFFSTSQFINCVILLRRKGHYLIFWIEKS